MIRITHLSGSLQGRTSTSAKPTIRVGRAADCDIRFDKERDPNVSNHHAEFLIVARQAKQLGVEEAD